MVKYKEYVQKMLTDNQEVFNDFRKIHDRYALRPDGLQEEFNKQGEKVQEIIREYENRLCTNTERGMYNKFSGGLAQKFQDEVRKVFSMIDHIGLKAETKKVSTFYIKKIKLP